MIRIVLDYLLIFAVSSVLLVTIAPYIPGISTASGPIATVVSAMIAGQLYGRRTAEVPASEFSWRVSIVLTLFSLAATAGITWGLGLINSENIVALVNALALIGVMSLLAIRFTFSLAAKQGARSAKAPNRKP